MTKPRTLHAELELDHIELAADHLILGLQVTWRNDILSPLEIQEVFLNLFDKGKKEPPVRLPYLERFARIPFQKTMTKIAGANSFPIQAGSTRVEYLRFLTREILDIADGKYPVELHSAVADGTYLHALNLKVASQFKFRGCPEAGSLSNSIISRARRIAPN